MRQPAATALPGSRAIGLRIVGVGASFAGLLLLAENLGVLGRISLYWPLVITVLGVGLVALYVSRRREAGVLGAGVYLICFSALALILNFHEWAALGRWWPVFIALLGISFLVVRAAGHGGRVVLVTGLLLLGLSVVFYLVQAVSARLWPVSLVLFGLSLLGVTSGKRASGVQARTVCGTNGSPR